MSPAHGWLLPVDPHDASQGHYFVPDWNDPFFLSRIQALLAALGARFNGDRRIGWLDIGLYGDWGEWHTSGLPDAADYTRGIPYDNADPYYALNTQAYLANKGHPGAYQAGTTASKSFIIDAYAAAFADTRLLMLTDDGPGLCHAMRLHGTATPIGLRRDSLGSTDWSYQFPDALPECATPADRKLIDDRWKTAPFVAEPFGNGSSPTFPCQTFETDPATGNYDIIEQVPQYHIASIRNGSMCAGTWSELLPRERHAYLAANAQTGFRLAPAEIHLAAGTTPAGQPDIEMHTHWVDSGVTPTYTQWQVEFSLWTSATATAPVAQGISGIDLRGVLPGTAPRIAVDTFPWPREAPAGVYHLRIRVVDPAHFAPPMQLALRGKMAGGYYRLGVVTLPPR